MTRIFAIASISLRNAIRSKVVLVLLAALALALIGLPLTIKGDGTLDGQLRILLRYTLGLATLILSLATIWAACASVASDIRDRHIQLILSKPLRPIQLWLGKWLGLCLLNFALLAFCMAIVYFTLHYQTRSSLLSAQEQQQLQWEVLSAYSSLAPMPRDLSAAVERRLEDGILRGEWPEDVSPEVIQAHVQRLVRSQANSVSQGERNEWIFELPQPVESDDPVLLRYRFSLSLLDMDLIKGRWSLIAADGEEIWSEPIESAARTWHQILIPPGTLTGLSSCTLVFENLHDRPLTIVFDPDEGLALRMRAGSFSINYLQAALLLFIHLAFLAAIGVTAGSFFSMPVAALTSFYALLLLYAGRVVSRLADHSHGHSHGPDPSAFREWFEAVSHYAYAGIYFIIRPIYDVHPLERVTRAEWIGWQEVGQAVGLHIGIYGGVLCLLAIWHLRRKEVALPQ
jgi:hypothetical protein